MVGGRIASAITANAAKQGRQNPIRNYRPVFEDIMRSGSRGEELLAALRMTNAPQKLVQAMSELLQSAKAKGVEKQTLGILRTYAKEIKNDIVMLTLARLKTLIDNTDGKQLPQRLEQCADLMKKFQNAADAVPAWLLDMQGMGNSFRALSQDNLREIFAKSLDETKGEFCPKRISRGTRKKIKKGEFRHIAAIAQIQDRIPDEPGSTTAETSINSASTTANLDTSAAEIKSNEFFTRTELKRVYLPLEEVWSDQPKRSCIEEDVERPGQRIERIYTVNEHQGKTERREPEIPQGRSEIMPRRDAQQYGKIIEFRQIKEERKAERKPDGRPETHAEKKDVERKNKMQETRCQIIKLQGEMTGKPMQETKTRQNAVEEIKQQPAQEKRGGKRMPAATVVPIMRAVQAVVKPKKQHKIASVAKSRKQKEKKRVKERNQERRQPKTKMMEKKDQRKKTTAARRKKAKKRNAPPQQKEDKRKDEKTRAKKTKEAEVCKKERKTKEPVKARAKGEMKKEMEEKKARLKSNRKGKKSRRPPLAA